MSEPYEPDNLLDRHSRPATLQVHYDQEYRRERELLARRLGRDGGDVLSVGCGWHPGRHLFPRPGWRMTGVDLNPAMLEYADERASRRRRGGPRGRARPSGRLLRRGALPARAAPRRLPGPARAGLRRSGAGCCAPAARSWRWSRGCGTRSARVSRWPTGPGSAHRSTARPTTSRSPRAPWPREARAAGLEPELHAVTFGWRRLPRAGAACSARARSARVTAARGAVRSHADADRAAVLDQRHAEAHLLRRLAGRGPALALVEAARACLSGRGEQPDGAVAVGRRRLHRPPVQVLREPRAPPTRTHEELPEVRQPGVGRGTRAVRGGRHDRYAAGRSAAGLCEHRPDIGAAELRADQLRVEVVGRRLPARRGDRAVAVEGLGHDLRQNGGVAGLRAAHLPLHPARI